eukprot:CAMPEP_0197024376 /NCGR_PEP_ID=MMETSP1384-20130603/4925_1 /TAXON_ID=29189 /ORGANISM="Ammonia sp." /LENGTH=55 /DNA_ID=CAMNT_0042452747 /DNA_START=152 /DNA_END=316 /DNA_ORIENTATION=-
MPAVVAKNAFLPSPEPLLFTSLIFHASSFEMVQSPLYAQNPICTDSGNVGYARRV